MNVYIVMAEGYGGAEIIGAYSSITRAYEVKRETKEKPEHKSDHVTVTQVTVDQEVHDPEAY